ncbi:MAG: hypothetical protein HY286_18975 [Planctomycetes bacterium]|nr:hypothetical protein [Planctomycetota bacterium]
MILKINNAGPRPHEFRGKNSTTIAIACAIAWTFTIVTDVFGQENPSGDFDKLKITIEQQKKLIEEQQKALIQLQARVSGLESRSESQPSGDLRAEILELQKKLDERLANRGASGEAAAKPSMRWGGYFSLNFEDRGGSASTFNAFRFVPQLEADLDEQLTFGAEFEFEHGGANVDFMNDDEIELEYAEIRASISREFNIRAGVLLLPFLAYNQRHDDPLHDLADRPYTAVNLVPTALSQPGIGVFGSVEPVRDCVFHYDVTVSNGFDQGFDSFEGARGARSPFNEDNNNNKMFASRVGATPRVGFLDAVDGGFSFLYCKYDDENERRMNGYGFDLSLKKGPVELRGEWGAFDIKRTNTARTPDDTIAFDPATGADHSPGIRGWYVEGEYHFFPFDSSIRKKFPFTSESDLAAIVRFQEMDLNTWTIGATPEDDRHSLTVGLALRTSAKTVLRVSYEFVRSPFRGPGSNQDAFVFGISTYF